jgi:addiction module antidote protein, HigA family
MFFAYRRQTTWKRFGETEPDSSVSESMINTEFVSALKGQMHLMWKSWITINRRNAMRTKNLITPGEILMEEFMKPMNISQNRLAIELFVPPARINAIIKGTRAITADTALRLGKYFGTGPEFWINLQANYDLSLANPKAESDLSRIQPYSFA